MFLISRPTEIALTSNPQKTDKSDPRWHMVDLQFTTRAKHFVSLALIKRIASGPDIPPPDSDYEYIGKDGIRAIKCKSYLVCIIEGSPDKVFHPVIVTNQLWL